jgi:hypothetical protein
VASFRTTFETGFLFELNSCSSVDICEFSALLLLGAAFHGPHRRGSFIESCAPSGLAAIPGTWRGREEGRTASITPVSDLREVTAAESPTFVLPSM